MGCSLYFLVHCCDKQHIEKPGTPSRVDQQSHRSRSRSTTEEKRSSRHHSSRQRSDPSTSSASRSRTSRRDVVPDKPQRGSTRSGASRHGVEPEEPPRRSTRSRRRSRRSRDRSPRASDVENIDPSDSLSFVETESELHHDNSGTDATDSVYFSVLSSGLATPVILTTASTAPVPFTSTLPVASMRVSARQSARSRAPSPAPLPPPAATAPLHVLPATSNAGLSSSHIRWAPAVESQRLGNNTASASRNPEPAVHTSDGNQRGRGSASEFQPEPQQETAAVATSGGWPRYMFG